MAQDNTQDIFVELVDTFGAEAGLLRPRDIALSAARQHK